MPAITGKNAICFKDTIEYDFTSIAGAKWYVYDIEDVNKPGYNYSGYTILNTYVPCTNCVAGTQDSKIKLTFTNSSANLRILYQPRNECYSTTSALSLLV